MHADLLALARWQAPLLLGSLRDNYLEMEVTNHAGALSQTMCGESLGRWPVPCGSHESLRLDVRKEALQTQSASQSVTKGRYHA